MKQIKKTWGKFRKSLHSRSPSPAPSGNPSQAPGPALNTPQSGPRNSSSFLSPPDAHSNPPGATPNRSRDNFGPSQGGNEGSTVAGEEIAGAQLSDSNQEKGNKQFALMGKIVHSDLYGGTKMIIQVAGKFKSLDPTGALGMASENLIGIMDTCEVSS